MSYSTGDYAGPVPVFRRSKHFERTVASTLTGFVTTGCFCLWGYIKDNAYRKHSRNLDEPETNLSNIIADISPMTPQAVSTNKMCCTRLTFKKVLTYKDRHTAHITPALILDLTNISNIGVSFTKSLCTSCTSRR
jgi:hypothetical protein